MDDAAAVGIGHRVAGAEEPPEQPPQRERRFAAAQACKLPLLLRMPTLERHEDEPQQA